MSANPKNFQVTGINIKSEKQAYFHFMPTIPPFILCCSEVKLARILVPSADIMKAS